MVDENIAYTKQCTMAYELIELKVKSGFDEGDYIWDGKKVRLIGHDCINLSEKANKEYPYFKFAMFKADDSLVVGCEDHPVEISIQYGEYVLETISYPTWIPTQAQLQRLISRSNNIVILSKFLSFLHMYNEHFNYTDTQEQMWLKFVMYELFDKLWSYVNNRWMIDTNKHKFRC